MLRHTDADGEAINLRLAPLNREGKRRVEQDVEIEIVVGEFPEVRAVDDDPAVNGLLEPGFEVIAASRNECNGLIAAESAFQSANTGGTGEDEVLVVGR